MISSSLRRLTFLAAAVLPQAAWATPITVNFEAAFVPSGGEQALPILVSNSILDPNSVRLRFSVPDSALIASLNSVHLAADVYDDDDSGNNEAGDLVFILNGIGQTNFVVTSFDGGLNGTTSADPLTVDDFVDPSDFADVLEEIQEDGVFFVRVNRNGGDYFVQGGTVTIDANLVPEPAALALAAFAFPLRRRLRSRTFRPTSA